MLAYTEQVNVSLTESVVAVAVITAAVNVVAAAVAVVLVVALAAAEVALNFWANTSLK